MKPIIVKPIILVHIARLKITSTASACPSLSSTNKAVVKFSNMPAGASFRRGHGILKVRRHNCIRTFSNRTSDNNGSNQSDYFKTAIHRHRFLLLFIIPIYIKRKSNTTSTWANMLQLIKCRIIVFDISNSQSYVGKIP